MCFTRGRVASAGLASVGQTPRQMRDCRLIFLSWFANNQQKNWRQSWSPESTSWSDNCLSCGDEREPGFRCIDQTTCTYTEATGVKEIHCTQQWKADQSSSFHSIQGDALILAMTRISSSTIMLALISSQITFQLNQYCLCEGAANFTTQDQAQRMFAVPILSLC